MKNLLNIAVAVVVFFGTFVAVAPMQQASAAPLSAATAQQTCSLPYITDANPMGNGKYIVMVEVAGHADKVKVTCNGKSVKLYQLDDHTWSFELKKGKTYTVKAKPKGGAWKSIDYRVRR